MITNRIIINFIKSMRHSGFIVKENALNTQDFGDYDDIMNFLKEEIKNNFRGHEQRIALHENCQI